MADAENQRKEPKKSGGRPLKFETVEVMQALIDKYFDETPPLEVTITGLALALDTTRKTLIEYEGRPSYVNAIKKAKTRVEHEYEKDLRRKGRSGDIFALKNFKWADKQELDHTTGGEKMAPVQIILPHTEHL